MFIAGIAKNERELFTRLVSAMTGGSTVGRYVVAGTGNGQLHGLELPISLFNTAIVLTCTLTTANSAEFSVTVGGAGAPTAKTYEAYNYNGLNFMVGVGSTAWQVGDTITIAAQGSSSVPVDAEVYLETTAGSIEEDLTLTCTGASTAGAGAIFNVSGSVSGLIGVVYQGARTELTGHTFTILDGVDFSVSDNIVYPLRASELPVAQRWEVLEKDLGVMRFDGEEAGHEGITRIAMRGRGNTGNENIYAQFRHWGLIDRYVNWAFTGFTGWTDGIDHTLQQGYIPAIEQPAITMKHELISFYISITGRRVMGVVGSGEVYNHFYVGLLQGHQAPTHYPYPMFVGGSNIPYALDDDLEGDTGYYQKQVAVHSAYWNPVVYTGGTNPTSQAAVYTFNDTYEPVGGKQVANTLSTGLNSTDYNNVRYGVAPFSFFGMSRLRANFDGTYTPVPVWLSSHTDSMKAVLGRFDGLTAVSSDNGQQAGNVMEADGNYHIVFNNVFRQSANDFCMIEVK
ncbi:hypothetical protein ACRXCV_00440 (plasmid) [Halobacteriovorax sp. GFR7]|uniref:hypothetical protein n=1 Tax=unclassified Halobacteriovorax TaxID=2639665 RepID=UPI003D95CECD